MEQLDDMSVVAVKIVVDQAELCFQHNNQFVGSMSNSRAWGSCKDMRTLVHMLLNETKHDQATS